MESIPIRFTSYLIKRKEKVLGNPDMSLHTRLSEAQRFSEETSDEAATFSVDPVLTTGDLRCRESLDALNNSTQPAI